MRHPFSTSFPLLLLIATLASDSFAQQKNEGFAQRAANGQSHSEKLEELEKPVLPTRKPGRSTDHVLLDVFPESTVSRSSDNSETSFRSKFTPSPSLWAEGIREANVFQSEMIHKQDDSNSFQLRIGRGGQIYSLRGPFGESVPPSWRSEKTHSSPWNDEVWQFVAVCTRYNLLKNLEKGKHKVPQATLDRIKSLPYKNLYFVHNSGAYIPSDTEIDSLYCPLLAVSQTEDSYQMLNWGLVPQVKTMHRSPILYYTQIRDAGDGVIEMTWVVHNFSVRDDISFGHLNAPWGGTRVSSLPHKYVVTDKGNLVQGSEILSKMGVVDVRKTAGFDIACASEQDDCPSLSLVYGRDKHLEAEQARRKAGQDYCQTDNSLYRAWRASEPKYSNSWQDWQTRPANSFRNYDVCEIIPKLNLDPGNSIWFRSYIVIGNKDRVLEQAKSLVDQVDYGSITFDPESTPQVRVFNDGERLASQVENSEAETILAPTSQAPAPTVKKPFRLFTRPVAGSLPVFLIKNKKTGQPVLTTDPYLFVKQEKLDLEIPKSHPDYDYYSSVMGYSLDENNSDWQAMIGFGYKQRPANGNWKQLSELLDKQMFPAATDYHLNLWVEVE